MKLTAIAPSPTADARRIGRQRIHVAREFPGFVNCQLARRPAGLLDDLDRSVQDDVEGKPAVPFLEEHVAGSDRAHAAPGTKGVYLGPAQPREGDIVFG